MKLSMRVSLAGTVNGREFSAQPSQIVEVPDNLGKKWVRSNLGERVSDDTPLSQPDVLADLSAQEAATRRCESCDRRRAQLVDNNRAYCLQCYKAVSGA